MKKGKNYLWFHCVATLLGAALTEVLCFYILRTRLTALLIVQLVIGVLYLGLGWFLWKLSPDTFVPFYRPGIKQFFYSFFCPLTVVVGFCYVVWVILFEDSDWHGDL